LSSCGEKETPFLKESMKETDEDRGSGSKDNYSLHIGSDKDFMFGAKEGETFSPYLRRYCT
jgi:hypothetical protein